MVNKEFSFNQFKVELSRILSIGLNNLLVKKLENKEYVNSLVTTICSENQQAGSSFQYILSEKFICNTNKQILSKLFFGLSNYSTNFVNLHQYKKQTIITNRNIARTYFADAIQEYSDGSEKVNLKNICIWLDHITDKYAIGI